MDKHGEAHRTRPNAASRDAVEDAKRRVQALGISWHDAVREAGLSRNTGFTMLRYEASVASLRKLEEWLVVEESRRPKRTTSKGGLISEWASLGEEMSELDPTLFEQMLEGIREVVKAERQKEGAFHKIFRANPDRRR